MQKKPLQNIDISKIVKSKTVYVNIFAGRIGLAQINYKYFFDSDSDLDNSLIVGCEFNRGYINGSDLGNFAPGQDFDPIGNLNAIEYIKADMAAFTVSLVDVENRAFFDKMPLTCLYYGNNGRHPKRMNNRIRMDKCYIQAFAPFNMPGTCDGNQIKYMAQFTFHYIPYVKRNR